MKSTKYDRRKNGARRGKELAEKIIKQYQRLNEQQPVITYSLRDEKCVS